MWYESEFNPSAQNILCLSSPSRNSGDIFLARRGSKKIRYHGIGGTGRMKLSQNPFLSRDKKIDVL